MESRPQPEPAPVHGATLREVQRWKAGRIPAMAAMDAVAVEEPLEIRLEGRPVAVLMRTPGHDRELVAGFFLSEGLAAKPEDFFEISECPSIPESASPGHVVDVLLRGDTRDVWKNLSRNIFSASSCGICGKATIEAVMSHTPALPVSPGVSLSPGVLGDLAARLRGGQEVFATTGGLHAAALFRMDGTLLCLREDVGRHNAVDKVLGASLLAGSLPLSAHILMVSGRVSFEVVQKALAAGVRVVAAISAPSSLAVDFAVRSGQTLIGFLRDGRFNVYANPGLLLSGSGQGFEG